MEEYRISKLKTYLVNILETLTNKSKPINVNMLGDGIDNYSLDKIPTESVVTRWISGVEIHRDVYSFRSRKAYSKEVMNNLQNIGFFEEFEEGIKTNNKEVNLPDIQGIEKIECLNCGTMLSNDNGNTAIFDIQIQITYRR